MRREMIESYIDQLRRSFGPICRPVAEEELYELYRAEDYARMIYHIQTALHLDLRLRLGLVNRGGPNFPAWVVGYRSMPMYGTAAFRQLCVTIYLRKTFLQRASFEEVVIAMAHELSHIVLESTYHHLRREEEAVDLTAMLLGFRDFFLTGSSTIRDRHHSLDGTVKYKELHLGYLTPEEVSYASTYMTCR